MQPKWKNVGERPLGRPWRRYDYNIKMDLKEMCQYQELD